MLRMLPALCALALLIASGAVHRWWAGSWSTSEEPAASAARLEDVPRTIADWDGQSQEINPRELEIAEVAGHLLRHYVRQGTHEAVTVLIVCGRPGPISVHTPDVCFSGQGFEMVGEKTHFAAEGRVFGDCPLKPGWHLRIATPDEMRWTWVFHQTEGPPVTKGLELLPGSSALHRAAREIVQAKQTYLTCLEKFGTAQWFSDAPIETIDDTDLPLWMREDVEECV